MPRFLGFEAKLVPGHVGAYRCLGDGGGLDFDLGHWKSEARIWYLVRKVEVAETQVGQEP